MSSLAESTLRNGLKTDVSLSGFSREALSFSIDFFRFYIRSWYSLPALMMKATPLVSFVWIEQEIRGNRSLEKGEKTDIIEKPPVTHTDASEVSTIG